MIDAGPLLILLPTSFTLGDAADVGLSRRVLERLVRQGRIRRVRPGVFRQPDADQRDRWRRTNEEHLARCREELHIRPGHAISHVSAGLVHGLPVLLHPEAPIHLTGVDRFPSSRRRDDVVVHHCDSMENETTIVDGLRVTTPARTLADSGRVHRLPVSVAMLDAAIARALVTREDVTQVLDAQIRWRGRSKGYQAVSLADPRRETWLESYSFVGFFQSGLPMPVPQVEVFDRERRFVARLDGLLPGSGVGLEADGLAKYVIGPHDSDVEERVTARLVAQNTRHVAVERLGLTMVRWTTSDIMSGLDGVVRRVQEAARRSSIEDFTGWLRIDGQWWRPR